MRCVDVDISSFPVPPEVGKIGKDSPTFIQPVSERSDGIKSFFQKQTTSPVKLKSTPKSDTPPSNPAGPSSPERMVKEEDTKVKAEGIKSEITPKDEEKGLGDDSNAPNPASTSETAGSRVKKEERMSPLAKPSKAEKEIVQVESEDEDKDTSTSLTKRKRDEKGGAGQRTKVTRKESDDGNKAVSHPPRQRG